MKWVKTKERLPDKAGLYTVKTVYSTIPEKRNYTGRQFENYDGYIVVEWLDESPSWEGDAVDVSQEDIWEDINEIKEDQSPYAALWHIKAKYILKPKPPIK